MLWSWCSSMLGSGSGVMGVVLFGEALWTESGQFLAGGLDTTELQKV